MSRASIATLVLMVALASAIITHQVSRKSPGSDEYGSRVSYQSYDLSVAGVEALPILMPYEGSSLNPLRCWSAYNDTNIRFLIEFQDQSDSVELMLCSDPTKQVLYQIIVDRKTKKAQFLSYNGGLWINGDKIERGAMYSHSWDVSKIKVEIKPEAVDIVIPWNSINLREPYPLLFQMIQNNGKTRFADSVPDKTSVLDRDIWNKLELK